MRLTPAWPAQALAALREEHWVHVVRTRKDVIKCYMHCMDLYGERCNPSFKVNAAAMRRMLSEVCHMLALSPHELKEALNPEVEFDEDDTDDDEDQAWAPECGVCCIGFQPEGETNFH